jgi:hypothetical protein
MDPSTETEVVIGGDVCPAQLAGEGLLGPLGVSRTPDLFMWTLDAALPAGPKRPGYSWIPFDPAALDELRLGKTTVAVTAANHITDFGDGGVRETLDELTRRGIRHVGAGVDQNQAEQNLIVDLPVGRVALLAFAETHPRVSALAADPTAAGVRPFELDSCLQAIRAARQQADWVWVVLHWGEEFVRFPDPEQRRMAWDMVDAGASLVVASHTHVPLGYERRGDATIFYGLGNFLYPPYEEERGYQYRWHPASRQGVLAIGRYEANRWSWQPREIRLSPAGVPRQASHAHCPNYGELLPADLSEYAKIYPRLRRRERMGYRLQRICFMSWQERAYRIRQLI